MATHGKRRALGQHFLRDPKIITRINDEAFRLAKLIDAKTWVEIGPGKGALTLDWIERLPQQVTSIQKRILIEKDWNLAEEWRHRSSENSLEVIEGDALGVEPSSWDSAPWILVSNLPYSVGTTITTKFIEDSPLCLAMVLMFQKEVGLRMSSGPKSPDRGSLSVWVQNYFDVKELLMVPPRAFAPPPKVDSIVLSMTRRQAPLFAGTETQVGSQKLSAFLKTCFSHRRKMLRSSLPKGSIYEAALKAAEIDPTWRPEQLDNGHWKLFFETWLNLSTEQVKT